MLSTALLLPINSHRRPVNDDIDQLQSSYDSDPNSILTSSSSTVYDRVYRRASERPTPHLPPCITLLRVRWFIKCICLRATLSMHTHAFTDRHRHYVLQTNTPRPPPRTQLLHPAQRLLAWFVSVNACRLSPPPTASFSYVMPDKS